MECASALWGRGALGLSAAPQFHATPVMARPVARPHSHVFSGAAPGGGGPGPLRSLWSGPPPSSSSPRRWSCGCGAGRPGCGVALCGRRFRGASRRCGRRAWSSCPVGAGCCGRRRSAGSCPASSGRCSVGGRRCRPLPVGCPGCGVRSECGDPPHSEAATAPTTTGAYRPLPANESIAMGVARAV